MEIKYIALNTITLIILLILFYLLKNYWPKYFESKATNQATKEDIGEITEIVENIKSGLLGQNELLKAQLSINNQHKLNVKTAEREALFDFNKHLSAWIYSLMRFSFTHVDNDNYKELKQSSMEFKTRQYDFDLADSHLSLFMHDKEFVELKRDLTISIINLEGVVIESIHKVYWAYSKQEFDKELAKDHQREQVKIYQAFTEEYSALRALHNDNTVKLFAETNTLHTNMIKLM